MRNESVSGSTGRAWSADERARLLASVPPFAHLPPAAVRDVARYFSAQRMARGGFVYLEGEPAVTLNVAADGRIKIVRETDEGRQVILRLIYPGEAFGVSGCWGESTYPASARALDDAVVLRLPVRRFSGLLAAYPALALAVIAELGGRLREAEARILDLQTERVDQRIARVLLRLAAGAPRSEVALSRQDLADIAGTTLSTASRTLSAWHRRGIVAAGRERIAILAVEDLTAIATVRESAP